MQLKFIVSVTLFAVLLSTSATAPRALALSSTKPLECQSMVNPARIVQLASTIRFLKDRIERTHTKLNEQDALRELLVMLERLGFSKIERQLLPMGASNIEIASVLLSKQPVHRSPEKLDVEPEKTFDDALAHAAESVCLVPQPRENIREVEYRPQSFDGKLTNARCAVTITEVAPLSTPLIAEHAVDEVERIQVMLRKRSEERNAFQQSAPETSKHPLEVQLVQHLATQVRRSLAGRRSRDFPLRNKLIIETWRGLGLPCAISGSTSKLHSLDDLSEKLVRGLSSSERLFLHDQIVSLGLVPSH